MSLIKTEITVLRSAMPRVAICLRLPSELCVNNDGTNQVTPPSSLWQRQMNTVAARLSPLWLPIHL